MLNQKNVLKFKKKHIPKRQLQELYLTKQLSIKQISFVLSLATSTIHRKLHCYGIKVRPSGKKRVDITLPKLCPLTKKNLTIKKIAQHFNCNPYTIRKRMDECGIKYRIKGNSITHYPKKNFSGNLLEAAYLIGFRLGDLTVDKEGRFARVRMSTTKPEQVELFKKLFGKYTYIRTSRKDKQGAVRTDCYLNDSFDFLLIENDYVPSWIYNDYLAPFASGYIDAEGSFIIDQNKGRFKLDSYDKNILSHMHYWLIKKKINSKLLLIGKKGKIRPAGYSFNEDLWRLNVNEAESLTKFINIVKPFMRHIKRIRNMNTCLMNIETRKLKRTI